MSMSFRSSTVSFQDVQQIDKQRRTFVAGLRVKAIRLCQCKQPDCPVFLVDQPGARELDRVRQSALDAFRKVYRKFDVNVD
jgi:recombinational DNA repair ATPase RecF